MVRAGLAAERNGGAGAHPVLEVGEVDVPAQRHHVDINHPEFGGDELEIEELSSRPDAPVSLGGERAGRV